MDQELPEAACANPCSGLPRRWLVTGAAGFIGSHLTEALLRGGHEVVGLDDFSTGNRDNLELVRGAVGAEAWARFRLVEGDLRAAAACREACAGVAVVLHHAALSSVPLSMAIPGPVLAANVGGTIELLEAARVAGVDRLVFASSSSVYGDENSVPAQEDRIGRPLSPYGASKRIGELLASTYQQCFGLETVSLRYFNVLGPRQDPQGAYSAVIPRWTSQLLRGETPEIYGDGETTRDFCPVEDVVQANLLAAGAPAESCGRVFNVALGRSTTLRQLFAMIRDTLADLGVVCREVEPRFGPFRLGDVRHSRADVSRAVKLLGFSPSQDIRPCLQRTLAALLAKGAP
ncbi:MAG: NAD-dependent epimerase/dehydratase family protein [Planctomycetes bacterium]|nr:NAD-dependent epimerase/dehydratase family protein [Planctomycetota bacterium]